MTDLKTIIAIAALSFGPFVNASSQVETRRGDVNGDGVVDVGVIITTQKGSRTRIFARVYSGVDGRVLYTARHASPPSGDFDGDGVIGGDDLALLLNQIGNPQAAIEEFDINSDGEVNAHDVLILIDSFGEAPTQGVSPCQEPTLPEGWCQNELYCYPCEPDDLEILPGGGGEEEEDSRGSGGGNNNPPPPPPPPTGCEVEISGHNYIAVRGGAGFIAEVAGSGGEIIWTVISGENLLQSFEVVNNPLPDVAVIYAGDTPGTVRLKAMVMNGGEIVCEADHVVRIKQYDEINVRYQAFIECPIIAAPPFAPGPPFFGGDGRSFSYNGGYRARFDIDFRVSDFQGITGDFQMLTNGPPFGLTTGYPSSNVSQAGIAPCTCVATGPFTSSATVQLNGSNHVIPGHPVAPHGVQILFHLAASNPLVALSPAINGDIAMLFTQFIDPQTGEQRLVYNIHASHDAFPAHEFYLQGQLINVIVPVLPHPNGNSNFVTGMVSYNNSQTPPTAVSAYSPTDAGAGPDELFSVFPSGPLVQWQAQGQLVTSQAP